MRDRLGSVLALGLLLALLAAPAAAQVPPLPGGGAPASTSVSVTMQLQDPAAALVPTRPYSLELVINYQYGAGAVLPPDQAAQDGTAVVCGEVAVPSPPPWANVTVIPPAVCFRLSPTFVASGTTVINRTIVEVNVTEGAPALEPYELNVTFTSPPTGTLAAGSGSVSRVLMPAYQGRLEVLAPPSLTLRGGSPQQLPLTVRNTGNGPNQVVFTNWTAPQGMRVDLPPPFLLARGEERTVHALVRSPWTTPVRGQVMVEATSGHPEQRDLQGDSPRSRIDVQANAAVPGAEAGLVALAGVAAAAFAARRR